MEKRILIIVVIVFFLSSCGKAVPFFKVAQGNHAFTKGDYQEANIAYIKAAASEYYQSWIAYNLGTVYYALGESEAAEIEWNIAAETDSPELLFRVLFNRGVLAYELGQYQNAYEDFRNALELNPASVEAKINLEYSLERISSVSAGEGNQTEASSTGANDNGEVSRILNYLKRAENQVWISTEEIQEDQNLRNW
jgi:tetratricopeptide (TPR) repeat protein